MSTIDLQQFGSDSSNLTNTLSFTTGKQGEAYLANMVGGESQAYYNTSLGARFIDQLGENGIAYESKVGYRSLDAFTRNQALKDYELIQTSQINGADWNFFRSGNTGRIGPSEPLQSFLEQLGINVNIYY